MPEPSQVTPDNEAADVQLWQRWRQTERPDVGEFLAGFPDLGGTEVVAVLLVDQRERWQLGERVPAESYLRRFPALESDPETVVELAYGEYLLREERGERPGLDEYLWRFPGHQDRLRLQVECHQALRQDGTTPSLSSAQATLAEAPEQARGTLLLPGYEVLEELGRGGMGVVYKARQLKAGRVVALKMVLAGGHAQAAEMARFRREAEAIARLQHPDIVQVFEVGEHQGLPFFSLEFCAGGSLDRKLAGRPLPAVQAALLLERLALAMQAAHEKHIVHRDLKPANVLLGEEGTPKISDFGLARKLDEVGQTQTGAVVGTPSYMAPEQASGNSHEVGPSADVYALGAILYECLAGRPPFKAATYAETVRQVLEQEPVPPRRFNAAMPRDLETICLKCLAKEIERRYATAGELALDLKRYLAGEPVVAQPAGRLERAVKWAQRRPALAALLAVCVLAGMGLAVLSGVALWQWQTAVTALERERTALDKERQERTRRALAQVDTLLSADPRAVPNILKNLAEQPEVLERLWQVWDEPDTPLNRPQRMRAALALLPVEPQRVKGALVKWMLEVPDPAELLVVRDALLPHAGNLRGDLWRQTQQPDLKPARRLRLLAVLAAFDPKGSLWNTVDEQTLEPWLADNPLYLGTWTEALQPASAPLLGPLKKVFTAGGTERRAAAASILARYARDQSQTLVELIALADDRQFDTLLPAVRRWRERALPLLRREVDRQASPLANEAAREALARRQASAGLALLKLGHAEPVWPLLVHSPYPEARSWLTLRLGPAGIDARVLVERLQTETEVSARRALILALGAYTDGQMPVELRQRLIRQLLVWYRDDPDAGIHGAIDWLLRHGHEGPTPRSLDWGQVGALRRIEEVAARLRSETGRQGRGWYVNGQGQTLAIVDARQPFLMGSPFDEAGRQPNEKLHQRQIGRRYALGTKPVTLAQFERFLKAHPEVKHEYVRRFSPDANCPVTSVTWYEAAQYCRWLSEEEGVPEEEMVYPPVAVIEKSKDGKTMLQLPADYLKRKGYRLPTEAEWEFAARAGARTSRYYGSSVELLPRYAWFMSNSKDRTWPVGQKRPNDLGLFDMHGNVWQWCQESIGPYPAGSRDRLVKDEEDERGIVDGLHRVLRGTSFILHPAGVRASFRHRDGPAYRGNTIGFRVARTCN